MRQRSDGYYAGLARMKQEHEDYMEKIQHEQNVIDASAYAFFGGMALAFIALCIITIYQ